MIKAKLDKLLKRYHTVKAGTNKKELSYDEMQALVSYKTDIDDMIQLLRDMEFALKEAKDFGTTYKTAGAKIAKEIKNLEVLKETL